MHSLGSDVTVLRSVFTKNYGVDGTAILADEQGSFNGSLTIGESIFALNTDSQGGYGSTPNVKATASVTKTNLGNNLYDDATGGFFDVVAGSGDHLGTPQYVVTTVADTFDHRTTRSRCRSAKRSTGQHHRRRAGNLAAGVAFYAHPRPPDVWRRSLTDTNVAFGDLDISEA